MRLKVLFTLLLFWIGASVLSAQEDEHDHVHDHEDEHGHLDHRNHIGIALGPVYVINEDEFAPGIHVHYTYLYTIGNAQFGTGLG